MSPSSSLLLDSVDEDATESLVVVDCASLSSLCATVEVSANAEAKSVGELKEIVSAELAGALSLSSDLTTTSESDGTAESDATLLSIATLPEVVSSATVAVVLSDSKSLVVIEVDSTLSPELLSRRVPKIF